MIRDHTTKALTVSPMAGTEHCDKEKIFKHLMLLPQEIAHWQPAIDALNASVAHARGLKLMPVAEVDN